MKNKLFVFSLILLLLLSTNCFAATKEQVISALYATYPVGDTTYRLPERIVGKLVGFLNKKELTSEQYDILLSAANKMADIANKAGTIDIHEMNKEDVVEGLGTLVTVSEAIDVDLEQELAENNISLESLTQSFANGEEPKKEETKQSKEENRLSMETPENQQEGFSESTNTLETIDTNKASGEETNFSFARIKDNNESSMGLLESFLSKNDGKELTGWKKRVAQVEKLFYDIKKKTKWTFQEFWDIIFKIVIIVTCIILFLLILLILFLVKTKWNRMIKYPLIILFVLMFFAILSLLVVGLVLSNKIKAVFKLYYLFA